MLLHMGLCEQLLVVQLICLAFHSCYTNFERIHVTWRAAAGCAPLPALHERFGTAVQCYLTSTLAQSVRHCAWALFVACQLGTAGGVMMAS